MIIAHIARGKCVLYSEFYENTGMERVSFLTISFFEKITKNEGFLQRVLNITIESQI